MFEAIQSLKSLSLNSWIVSIAVFSCLFYFILSKITGDSSMALVAVEYEVFGRVQGVFFRKFTNEKALSLGLRGWVKNTRDGTVRGELEGDVENVNLMKSWLQKTGSPQSRIDKAVFNNQRQINSYNFDSFRIIR